MVEHPLDVFRQGICADKPVVLGSTRDESRIWFALGVMAIPDSREALAGEMDRFFLGNGATILARYLTREPNADLARLREIFLTDTVYRLPAVRTALSHAQNGGRAYLYRFDWTLAGDKARFGAAHGFDGPFVWAVDPSAFPLVAGAANDATSVARQMSGALIAFARTGDPGWPQAALPRPQSQVFGGDNTISELDGELLAIFEGAERR